MTAPRRLPWTHRALSAAPELDPPSPIEYLRGRGGELARYAEQAARELAEERTAPRTYRSTQLPMSYRPTRRDHRAAAAGDDE